MQDLFSEDIVRRLTKAGCGQDYSYGHRRWRLPDTGAVVTEDEALRWLDRRQGEIGGEGGHE